VAFYLMLALRTLLRDKGWFESRGIAAPNLAEYLDLVALGTVADVVPLDTNNRILTWQGLSRIRAGKCRPGIKALLEIANRDPLKLAASDLGFALGPRLNAAGRLDDMSVGVALLLCDNIGEARVLANELDALNQTRKEIEQGMQAEALTLCEKLERSGDTLPGGLAMYHPEWHQGVVGILASRIKERFHRPVIAFAPAGDGTLKGSGRSIQGLHMRDALERLDTLYPGLMIKFGGHAMAAGLSLEEAKFDEFQRLFGELVTDWIDPALLQGEVVSDGELSPLEMTMDVAQMLRDAGPWGQMFPEPLFDGRFRLLQQRIVGERHLKVMVEPVGGGRCWTALPLTLTRRYGRTTACARSSWRTNWTSTSFAVTAPFRSSSTISGQFSGSNLYKKGRGFGTIPLLSPHFDKSIKENRPCLKLIR
jgi:single-stranded-DNA-specific exonuclease